MKLGKAGTHMARVRQKLRLVTTATNVLKEKLKLALKQ